MANYTGNNITTLETVATQFEGKTIVSNESYGIGTRFQGVIVLQSDTYGYAGGWFATDDDDGSFPGPAGIWQVI